MKATIKYMAEIPRLELKDYVGDAQDAQREKLYQEQEDIRSKLGEEILLSRKRVSGNDWGVSGGWVPQ